MKLLTDIRDAIERRNQAESDLQEAIRIAGEALHKHQIGDTIKTNYGFHANKMMQVKRIQFSLGSEGRRDKDGTYFTVSALDIQYCGCNIKKDGSPGLLTESHLVRIPLDYEEEVVVKEPA